MYSHRDGPQSRGRAPGDCFRLRQYLARKYPILNHFDSPADVIAQLHEHERVELVNHKACNGILHALVDSIAGGTAEEIGQQLLLLAYMPLQSIRFIERSAAQPRRSSPGCSLPGVRSTPHSSFKRRFRFSCVSAHSWKRCRGTNWTFEAGSKASTAQ